MKLVLAIAWLTAAPAASLRAQSAKLPDLPLKRTPTPTTAEITARDVMTRTYIIADDSMEGRDTGRRGGLKSATYIAAELKRLGLEPAGDNGTFFQAIPWINRAPDTASALNLGETALKWGTDFIVLPKLGFALALGGQPFGGGFDGRDVPTIFGGRMGD